MEEKGILFVISGPSGVGKGTLRKRLMECNHSLVYSISATTRKPRSGETDGRDYFFRSLDEFQRMIAEGELLEWAFVYNNYYGTPRGMVEETLAAGRDVILEIDIQGAMKVKKAIPDGVFIFILPPSTEELMKRIVNRGQDSGDEIKRRLSCYREEINHIRDYEYLVINDDLDRAARKLDSIIEAEKCRVKRHWLGGIDSVSSITE